MPIDHALPLREAVVAHLRASPGLTALVPALRVFGEQPPAEPQWPFIRVGMPVVTPYEAACWDGSSHVLTVHGFARGPGADACARIAAAVVAAMESFAPTAFSAVENEWTGSNIIRDTDEAGAYHSLATFRITTVEVA